MNRRKFLSGLFALPVAAAITINSKLAIFEYVEPKTLASIGIDLNKLDVIWYRTLGKSSLREYMEGSSIHNFWVK